MSVGLGERVCPHLEMKASLCDKNSRENLDGRGGTKREERDESGGKMGGEWAFLRDVKPRVAAGLVRGERRRQSPESLSHEG